MAGIFINYRRDDAPGVAGRLFDYLTSKYSRGNLFMNVDAMQPGVDFARQLDTQVSQYRVLLAVIGPRWLDAKDQTGRRRLDSNKDYVRIEWGVGAQARHCGHFGPGRRHHDAVRGEIGKRSEAARPLHVRHRTGSSMLNRMPIPP
jgi:hypothetical protein